MIGTRSIGEGSPLYFIAEIGVNHNGSLELALDMVDVAADAGADAVKLQTFDPESLVTSDAPKAAYQERNSPEDDSQLSMLKRLQFSSEDHLEVRKRCEERHITFLSTPFDKTSANFLENLGVAAYKVSSGDLTNIPFLKFLAGKNRPLILSTGMATIEEVRDAVHAAISGGCDSLALLHCVSDYPADPATANIAAIDTLRNEFDVPVGWSDHTIGSVTSIAATARGAHIIEKHFTLDRSLPGPDQSASIEPDELKSLIKDLRLTEASLGDGLKRPTTAELETAKVARRSIFTARAIPAGARITAEDLRMSRPGIGLSPARMEEVIGRTSRESIPAGTLLTLDKLD